MRREIATLFATASFIAVLSGCGAAEEEAPPELTMPSEPPVVDPSPPVADPSPPQAPLTDPCRVAREYENELEQLRQMYTEDHPRILQLREWVESAKAQCLAAGGHTPRSGKWVEKDGILECDGYMTRRADQDYCSAEVPEDWVPFTYDGKNYYVQPLTDSR